MYDVLLVDDEEIFLEYMQKNFDWEKYHCRICACLNDGESALEYIASHCVDIVFIDISMPHMNGLEVCERAVQLPNTPAFVIATAYDEFSFAYRAIKLGIADYLLKPFTTEELEKSLVRIIRELEAKMPADKRQSTAENSSLIGKIEDYLKQHYQEAGLTVTRMARELQFENSYLRRLYKRDTGKTVFQRLEELRMERAKEMLMNTNRPNAEIAVACGFADQYYFSRRFKQLCGCTPSAFRNQMKVAPNQKQEN